MLGADVTIDGMIMLDNQRRDDVMARKDNGMIRVLCPIGAAMQTAADTEEKNAIFFFQKWRKWADS